MEKTEDEWKKELSPEAYAVLREGATEAPFTGAYVDMHEPGVYRCRACEALLFTADTKFDSGSGWPSFTDPATAHGVGLREDNSHGMHRIEAYCNQCGSHLGHVFDDGPKDKGGKRYCINSVALEFTPES